MKKETTIAICVCGHQIIMDRSGEWCHVNCSIHRNMCNCRNPVFSIKLNTTPPQAEKILREGSPQKLGNSQISMKVKGE